MRKPYITPTLNVENAQPESLLCVSITSNVEITPGGGSDGNARAEEWNMWGEGEDE